jgi:hypothetical protein
MLASPDDFISVEDEEAGGADRFKSCVAPVFGDGCAAEGMDPLLGGVCVFSWATASPEPASSNAAAPASRAFLCMDYSLVSAVHAFNAWDSAGFRWSRNLNPEAGV